MISGTGKEGMSGGIPQEGTIRAPFICDVLPVCSGMEAVGEYLCDATTQTAGVGLDPVPAPPLISSDTLDNLLNLS